MNGNTKNSFHVPEETYRGLVRLLIKKSILEEKQFKQHSTSKRKTIKPLGMGSGFFSG